MTSRGPPISVSPGLGLEACISISHFFVWALGIELESLHCMQTLYQLRYPPSSLLCTLQSKLNIGSGDFFLELEVE